MRDLVASELDAAQNICLTSDGWSSPTQEHYCAVTAHFIGRDFKLKSVVLDVRVLEDKTAEGHCELISTIVDDFHIGDRIIGNILI